MSEKYKIHDPEGIYFLTSTVVGWIDVFSRTKYADIIVDSLRYCIINKGLQVHAFVIMTNHMHYIVSATDGNKLSDILRDFKRHTSKRILEAIQNEVESRREWMLTIFRIAGRKNTREKVEFQFWQADNHPIGLNTNFLIDQKLEYIHRNPVRAGLVTEAEHWVYSSAAAYAGLPSEIPIVFLK
jgi:REP element-mobilizing transposase RayT